MELIPDPRKLTRDEGWSPNPKQDQFLSIPTSIKEGAYLGGAGSGKSDVLLYYALVHGWYRNPRFKQVFMRRTFPELRREIIPRSREIYQRFDATFNKGDMAWTFPAPGQAGGTGITNNGSMIFMGHCESENDVHNYDSMEINLFTPDELTSFTKDIYLYIGFQRGRTSDPNLPAIIRSAGMPGNIGHGWVKKRFIDPYPPGGKIIVGRANVKRIFIHATQADNRFIDPTYKQTLEALPDAERDAKLYGSFDAYLGQVFDEFRDHRYTDEPENAVHVVEPFDIPPFWPKFYIGDWGFAAMTYILSLAVSPTRRVYAYREDHWRKTKIEEWAPFIKYNVEKEIPKEIKFCRSAGQDRGQEHTIEQQISDALGCQISLASSGPGSRVAGKQLLHEYLRWQPRTIPEREKIKYNELHSQWLFRNKGIEEYEKYLKLFEPEKKEENIPKLQIFNTCPLLIGAIKQCVYAKADKNGVLAEDVAEFDGDDPYDTIRYGLDTVDRYFESAERDLDRMEKQEALVNELKETQDWTAFYMRARLLESNERSSIKSIKRY